MNLTIFWFFETPATEKSATGLTTEAHCVLGKLSLCTTIAFVSHLRTSQCRRQIQSDQRWRGGGGNGTFHSALMSRFISSRHEKKLGRPPGAAWQWQRNYSEAAAAALLFSFAIFPSLLALTLR